MYFSWNLFPGMIVTENDGWKRMKMVLKVIATFLGKSKEMGAQTTIHCIVTSDNINGKYFADCREERLLVSRSFYDVKLAHQLYQKTKEFLKLWRNVTNVSLHWRWRLCQVGSLTHKKSTIKKDLNCNSDRWWIKFHYSFLIKSIRRGGVARISHPR